MKLHKTITTIILTSMMYVTSQGQHKGNIRLQKEIDSLNKIFKDKRSQEFRTLHERLKTAESIGYYDGMLGTYLNLIDKCGFEAKRDSLLYYCNQFEVLEKLHPNPLMRVEFLYNKGQGLDMFWGLHEEAIKYYFEAYRLIKETNGDLNKKASIKKLMALFYNNKKQYDKAIKLLLEDIKDTSAIDFNAKMGYLQAIAITYQNKKQPVKSSLFNNIQLKISLKRKDSLWNIRIKSTMLKDYYLTGHYKKVIDSGLVLYKKLLHDTMPAFRVAKLEIDENLGLTYKAIGDYKNAILYLTHVIDNRKMPDLYLYLYDNLASCYEANNDLKLAMNTYKKKNTLIDTIHAREQKAFVNYYDNQIKTINIKKEAENIMLKNKRQELYISILLVSLLSTGLFIAVFVLSKKYKLSKEKVAVLKKNELNLLKNHIKVRENELSAILLSEAKKTGQLDQIKTILTEGINNNDSSQMLIARESLKQYLKSAEEFDIFSERLESQYPGIVYQLKGSHPELSQNDIRHCLLIKLGLSLKESAQLLNVTPGTVKTARNRVVRKLDLPEDVNFKSYLDQIDTDQLNVNT
jgi:DNA-binding CsgD family transcriptional regulator